MKKIQIIAEEIYYLDKEYEVDDETYEALMLDESITVEDFVEYDLFQSKNNYNSYLIRDENGNILLSKQDKP